MFFVLTILLSSLSNYSVYGKSNGALAGSCMNMIPGHSDPTSQTGPAPFQLTVDKSSYKGGDEITVTLAKKAAKQFKGYLIEARDQNGKIITGFSLSGSSKYLTCSNANDAVTHTEASPKDSVSFQFTAPTDSKGNLTMYATAVESYKVFWVKIPSDTIYYSATSISSTMTASMSVLLTVVAALML